MPLRLTLCLLVPLAVAASGCGSSETASTASKSAAVPTTVTQNPGTTNTQNGTTKAVPAEPTPLVPGASKASTEQVKRQLEAAVNHKITPAVAEVVKKKLAHPIKLSNSTIVKQRLEAAKRKLEAVTGGVPIEKQFSTQEQLQFMTDCAYGKGSPTVCKCILVKQEMRAATKGKEVGRALAELLGLDYGLQEGATIQGAVVGVPFPGSGPRRVPLPSGLRLVVERCLG
jgi:hypothetical protein